MTPATPRFVSRPEIARRLGISAATLTRRLWPVWESLPGWPGPVPGYAARYDWLAVETFLRAQWPAEIGGGPAGQLPPVTPGAATPSTRRARAAAALAAGL